MKQNALRTNEMFDKYLAEQANTKNYSQIKNLNNPKNTKVAEYTYWLIIKNNFPYDTVAIKHDLLIPKRCIKSLKEATDKELNEYNQIIKELDEDGVYDAMLLNFRKGKSILSHYHLHLLEWKKIER